jgi:uncharacterized membrane protein
MAQAQYPLDVVVAAFPDEKGGKDALRRLQEAKKQGIVDIKDAAVLRRGEDNKLHIADEADKGVGRGAVIGGVAGAAVGILAGPIGWAALGGAAIGGLAGKLSERGFNDQRLKRVGDSLTPGSSAMIAVIEHTWLEDVQGLLEDAEAEVITESVAADVANQLDQEAERMQQQNR